MMAYYQCELVFKTIESFGGCTINEAAFAVAACVLNSCFRFPIEDTIDTAERFAATLESGEHLVANCSLVIVHANFADNDGFAVFLVNGFDV